MWICMFIISLLHLFWYNQHTWLNRVVPCFEPLAEEKQYRNNTSSYLGPMRSPTKFISGYSSCGIITLSLTRVAGGLGKIKVVLIKIWLPSTTDPPVLSWAHHGPQPGQRLGKGHNGESSAIGRYTENHNCLPLRRQISKQTPRLTCNQLVAWSLGWAPPSPLSGYASLPPASCVYGTHGCWGASPRYCRLVQGKETCRRTVSSNYSLSWVLKSIY